jgi:hypothetical protein
MREGDEHSRVDVGGWRELGASSTVSDYDESRVLNEIDMRLL